MKFPAELTYAAFRHGTITRRFLFCQTDEKPHFGDPSFDFMGFFGFGSGEFEGEVPPEYLHLRVRIQTFEDPELAKAVIGLIFQQSKKFVGFYTKDGETLHLLVEEPEGTLLVHMPDLNWHYYTQLGDKDRAYGITRTLMRRHFLFETLEEQNEKLEKFGLLAVAI